MQALIPSRSASPQPERSAQLQRDQGAGQARFGAIEEEAHAECFGTLYCDQAHLAANVIRILEQGNLGFVEIRIAFQAGDAIFERLTEAGADFETIFQG
jgi:hypothetical protein